MWLLKFHLAFSILCLITYFGVNLFLWNKKTKERYQEIFKDKISRGWFKRLLSTIKVMVGCFVPIINVFVVFATFIVCTNPDWVIKKAKEQMEDNSLSNINKEQLKKIVEEVHEVTGDKPVVVFGKKSVLGKHSILAEDDLNIKE